MHIVINLRVRLVPLLYLSENLRMGCETDILVYKNPRLVANSVESDPSWFGFLVVRLQIVMKPFSSFHHSNFDYMCFTVMFHR